MGWLVATGRDAGAGWRKDSELTSPDDAAHGLIGADFLAPRQFAAQLGQLTSAGGSEGIPIVSAFWSGDRWAVLLRGTGGGFGAAGTTQVCLAPLGVKLAEAWAEFWTALDGRLWIDDLARLDAQTPRSAALSRPPAIAVKTALRLLALDRPLVEVDVAPSETPAIYQSLADLLPEAVVRGIVWSTCHVVVALPRGSRAISGRWPDGFKKQWEAAWGQIELSGRTVRADELPPLDPDTAAGLDWLVTAGAERARAEALSIESVDELLDFARTERPVALDDLVRASSSHRIDQNRLQWLARDPSLVEQFVRSQPDAAGRLLAAAAPGEAMWTAITAAAIRDHSLPLPRASLTHELALSSHTARALSAQLSIDDRLWLARYLLGDAPSDAALAEAQPWLRRLGLTRNDLPQYFPPTSADLIATATSQGPAAAIRMAGRDAATAKERVRLAVRLADVDPGTRFSLLVETLTRYDLDTAQIRNFLSADELTGEKSDATIHVLCRVAVTMPTPQRLALVEAVWQVQSQVRSSGTAALTMLLALALGYVTAPPSSTPPPVETSLPPTLPEPLASEAGGRPHREPSPAMPSARERSVAEDADVALPAQHAELSRLQRIGAWLHRFRNLLAIVASVVVVIAVALAVASMVLGG